MCMKVKSEPPEIQQVEIEILQKLPEPKKSDPIPKPKNIKQNQNNLEESTIRK